MTDQTRPKPFPEARPPHLPDVVTQQSPWLAIFGAITFLVAWRAWTSVVLTPGDEINSAIAVVLASIPSIVPPLIGAMVFWRHPDARRRLPLLVFGLGLFAVGELLATFAGPISQFLYDLAPPSDPGASPFTPAQFAFSVFTALMAVFALLYVGAGLASTRVQERRPFERPLAVWLAALAVVGSVIGVATLTFADLQLTPMLAVQAVLGTVLSTLSTFAWAYVTAVTIGGWRAGEVPRGGWRLAAIGAAVLFSLRLVLPALSAVPFDSSAVPLLRLVAAASYAGWILFAAGFALGMPTPPPDPASSDPVGDDPTGGPPAATPPGSEGG